MPIGEFELIERHFTGRGARRAEVRIGVGDDAAVVMPPAGLEVVLALDTIVSGIHFPADTAPQFVGHRALAVNLSDIAAMGAEPAWALLGLALPAADEAWVAEFSRGLDELARRHGVALVGGDTTRGPLTASIILVVLTGIYTIAGGLSAVIYTEVLQTLILIAGAVALTVIGLERVGGFEGLRAAVPPDYFHMMKPMSDPEFPWTGIFIGAPILGIWYWCTDQVIVQRVLSAKDEGHARGGCIMAGYLKILPVFMLVLPGLIALALYPGAFHVVDGRVTNGDVAYPTLVISLLPTGLVGVMIAALLAALMGSMASVFNSASTLVTLDFYKKVRPQASEHQLVFIGRIATAVMVFLGILWVPFINLLSAQLFIYLQSVQAYVSPPIAVCFLLGILWPRLNGSGAISSLLTGFVLGSVRFVLEVLDKTRHYESSAVRWLVDMNFLHYAILMFAVCAAVLIVVSLMTAVPDRAKLAGLTFATLGAKIDVSTLRDPSVLDYRPAPETTLEHRINLAMSALLVITVVALWIYFA